MRAQRLKHKKMVKNRRKTKKQYAAIYDDGDFRVHLLSEILVMNTRIVSERSGDGFVIFGIYGTTGAAKKACEKMVVFQEIREVEGSYANN